MWIRLPKQNASDRVSGQPISTLFWYLKLAVLIVCMVCAVVKIRPQLLAQNNPPADRAARSTTVSQSTAPTALPIPVTPPREISVQILHRALLESVWGEPTHCAVRQSIQIFDKKCSSFGNYVRGGKGLGSLRLTLQVAAGDQMNSVFQISDGDLLTTYESIGNHAMMMQIDLGKVRERLIVTKDNFQDPIIAMYLAIGGQAEELRRICQKYDWTKITEGQLGDQKVWWIRGQSMAQPLHPQAKALVDTRLFEQPYDAQIPPNIKLAIGHVESSFPFWLYQVEKWNDGDELGQNKSYVLTEWDAPARLLPEQLTPDLFRLSPDHSMQEIREETKLYLPPLQNPMAAQTQSLR